MRVTNYDFCGYATRNDVKCADGRVIRKNAFIEQDGMEVPLVWNHQHNSVTNVLGHGILENRDDGVFIYGFFNDSPQGKAAKESVKHKDVKSLSIFANKLIQQGFNVMHGMICEVSLVLKGANPMATIEDIAHGMTDVNEIVIESVMYHSDDDTEDVIMRFCEPIEYIEHGEQEENSMNGNEQEEMLEQTEQTEQIDSSETLEHAEGSDEETIGDVINSMTDKQKKVMEYLIGEALDNSNSNEGGNSEMKHNVFDNDIVETSTTLSHADQMEIIQLAKNPNCGTLQNAIASFAAENDTLQHGFSDTDLAQLFPEYKDLKTGAPELITRDHTWVNTVMNGVHKSPISRIRTRQMDARDKEAIRALGYVKGTQKKLMGNPALSKRTTDPQTVYVKDKLERDDIIDITDFDVVQYLYGIMMMTLKEEIAQAILIGDQRDADDDDKILPEHIRPIYGDDPLYTIYKDVDIAAQKTELQGTDTGKYFGENFIYAEAIITAALYAREKYKGTGKPAMFCTPHLVNVMLLARDFNGRRIYNNVEDLKAALNVSAIETVEQFEGVQRTDALNKKHELLALFINLSDYHVGSTKGGEITKFEQFDIDFNRYKYLIETRLSGANTKLWSAIALEMPVVVTQNAGGSSSNSGTPAEEDADTEANG